MPNFRWKKSNAPKFLKINRKVTAQNANDTALSKAKKKIFWQAGLAGITVVLTIIIVFAMTSAWYTNIVQSSGLVFETEAWGFEGTIQVSTDPVIAGPGDDGVIHLEVSNDSENIIAVGVNISKARMDKDMRRRLYFYVDTQQVRNGETMSRVYLNNQEGYNYTLFGNSQLRLTKEAHNAAQLKWQWVYDVLGYYVYGTEYKDSDGNRGVIISEYLRPIEYNYDDATTTFMTDEDKNQIMVVETVDGKTTVDEFVKKLSETDGYKGTIDPAEKLEAGFYPVDVKKDDGGNNYGIYAYVCNYAEIERETQLDTKWGKDAASGETPPKYEAQLTVSAQKNKNNVVNVSSLASLKAAIEMGAADVIQLTSNITISSDECLLIAKDQRALLDLNEHTIYCKTAGTAIKVEEGGSLIMLNGTVEGADAEPANVIYAVGGDIMLNKVKIQGCETALRIADEEGVNAIDSKVHLVNCNLDTSSFAIVIKGNGSASEQLTQLVVEKCEIKSDLVGIGGNGTNGKHGTDIQVIDSLITGTDGMVTTAIFHPQMDSTLTIYNSILTSYTGVAIKGGSVNVIDSKIHGTGEMQSPAYFGSGSADTGDGIYIEANYEGEIQLEISGESKISSDKGYSLQVYEPDAPNVTIQIYEGEFDEEQPDEYIAVGSAKNGFNVKRNDGT